MMKTFFRIARPLRLATLAVAPGSLCFGATAHADTRSGVDVLIGVAVDTNPYLAAGGYGTDIAGSLQINPWLQVTGPISSIDLRGDLSLRRYTKGVYGTQATGSVSLSGTRALSSTVSASGGLTYQTSLNGILPGFSNVRPNDPLPPPTTPLPDVSLGGNRARSQSMSANAGLGASLSDRDSVGASVTASRSTYDAAAGRNFTFINGGFNYSRAVSSRIRAIASVNIGKSDYSGTRVGDGTIITPMVGIDMTVNEHWTLSATVGAAISRSNRFDGAKLTVTSLSGQARICRTQHIGPVCLAASRAAQPTGIGAISTMTNVSLNYDPRISRRDTLSLGLIYSSSKDDAILNRRPVTVTYYSASGNLTHNFSRRVSAYVSTTFSKINNASNKFNSYSVSAGLRISFGAIS